METQPAPDEASEPLLPMRLTPFAPPDPEAEARTASRLQSMSFAQLRTRRNRIDKRLFELGLSIGEPAAAIPSVRGTGLVDIDRILRKLERLEEAREQRQLEREVDLEEGKLSGKLAWQVGWLTDAFQQREIRARRQLLLSELGLALCACDQRVLATYAPHVKQLLAAHLASARRIDELFVEMRILEEEFARRAQQGLEADPPKEIDLLLAKALDQVDDVTVKVGDTIAELGKTAAKSAAKTAAAGGWAVTRGAAKGAWALGSKAVKGLAGGESEDDDPALEVLDAPPIKTIQPRRPAPPPALPSPDPEIPELIRKLAQLHADGILTAEEFAAKKAELLDRL